MEVLHPYGTVGKLARTAGHPGIAFGQEVRSPQLIQASEMISTFSEQVNDDDETMRLCRVRMANASATVFLGFAYHEQNLEYLLGREPVDAPATSRRVFGTVYGMSKPDVSAVEEQLADLLRIDGSSVALGDFPCSAIFNEYSRSLSALRKKRH